VPIASCPRTLSKSDNMLTWLQRDPLDVRVNPGEQYANGRKGAKCWMGVAHIATSLKLKAWSSDLL
jgi:hypothetical protein